MKSKDEQIRELKSIVVVTIIGILILGGMAYAFGQKKLEYQQELQSCQDKVPVWEYTNFREVPCSDIFGENYVQGINEECGLWDRVCIENCEVREDGSSVNFRATINPDSVDIVNVTLCIGEEPCEVIE